MPAKVKRSVLSAIGISLLTPFLGLIYVHKPLRALICAFLILGAAATEAVLGVCSTWPGFAAALGFVCAVWLYSVLAAARAARKGLTPEEACHDIGPWIVAWALVLVVAGVLADPFPYRMYEMSSLRMHPAIREHEYVVGRKVLPGGRERALPLENLKMGDIVAVQDPQGVHRLRRVLGLAGDVLELRDGALWRNGENARPAGRLTLPGGQAQWVVPGRTIFVSEDNEAPPNDTATVYETRDVIAKMLYVVWSDQPGRIGVSF